MPPALPCLCEPRSLLTPRRLDIAVKWRLFRHLATGTDPDAERVYRWHIEARTRGIERGSWKKSVDDYVTAARALWESIGARGFDPTYPIPIGSNGLLMGGAHRIAAAIAREIEVYKVQIEIPGRAKPWDLPWFQDAGAPVPDIRRMLADWDSLKRCHALAS